VGGRKNSGISRANFFTAIAILQVTSKEDGFLKSNAITGAIFWTKDTVSNKLQK
jgi:hypothetical protein